MSEDQQETPSYTSVAEVGVSADRNARYRRFMEDSHVVVDQLNGAENQGLFCVFDGHGGKGCAMWLKDNFKEQAENVFKEIGEDCSEEQVIEALKTLFKETDLAMKDKVPIGSGACAVVALVRSTNGKPYLYTANCGDSRAVLCRNGSAIRLTYDHKCEDPEEAARIKEKGGFVVNNRVNGMVAITRSLGDHCMKDYIISDPHIVATELTGEDAFVVLACDGVWDVYEDQNALDLIKDMENAKAMSKKLLVATLKAGSTDNVSVMVVKFNSAS